MEDITIVPTSPLGAAYVNGMFFVKSYLEHLEYYLKAYVLTDENGMKIQNFIYSFKGPVNYIAYVLQYGLAQFITSEDMLSYEENLYDDLRQLNGFVDGLELHLIYLKMFMEYFMAFALEDL